MNANQITEAMKAALKWLRNRHGDGVFGEQSNASVLIAAGDRAPVMRQTWTRLAAAGLVETYDTKRLRVTRTGNALDLTGVVESKP